MVACRDTTWESYYIVMVNTLIDNSTDILQMLSVLKDGFNKEGICTVKIATGYWDLPGLALLTNDIKAFLEKDNHRLQLLIGKDPYVYPSQVKNPKYKDKSYPDDFIRVDINELEIKDAYKEAVRLLLEYCTEEDDSKIQIRIFRKNEHEETQFLHAKCYIFESPESEKEQETDKRIGFGLIGSSNFTENGLTKNAELNYLDSDGDAVLSRDPNQKSLLRWFEEKWDISEPWNKQFLEKVLKEAPIIKALEVGLIPYEVYIKYLQSQLGDIADPNARALLKSYLPESYSPLGYQLDAVQQCFFIMKQYQGFILADVVGLGKTVVGMLIIKKFLAEASILERERKVLIVTPPAIKKNWIDTIKDFDNNQTDKVADCIQFITTGSIGKIVEDEDNDIVSDESESFDGLLQYDNYGLIIIDESHNFRNSDTQKYKDLDKLIGDIQLRTGNAPYVGLLSATPQNNSPEDIKNQIYLFQRKPNQSNIPGQDIKGGKLDSFMSSMRRQFDEARKDNTPEGKAKLQNVAKKIRENVLDFLVVRRTRTDIKKHYPEDSRNLHFPKIGDPQKLEYQLDPILCKLFSDTITAIVVKDEKSIIDEDNHIGFYRYGAIAFFKTAENKKLYEFKNLTVDRVARQLSNIMRILLVKRLESSFSAFRKSLHNLQRYTQNMIDMLAEDVVYVCPDIDVNKEIEKAGSLQKAIPVLDAIIARKGKNNLKFRREDFKDDYLTALQHDMAIINDLCRRWDENDLDPKMDAFKFNFKTRLFDESINNPHGYDKPRLVIFTEAIDTLDSLERYINSTGHRALKVSAKTRNDLQQTIIENFDANSIVKKDDYDVLVTTEVLAEGVNLHRANVILNYDTPWNATRLMQRIGRVNRIGSKEDFVHVFNFYPTNESEAQIQLIKIAYSKLQAFHTMFGEDNKVFSEMEELSAADFNNLIDDEESPFSQYISDLKAFQTEYPDRYQYITNLPLENLGGTINTSIGNVVAVVAAANRGLTNIRMLQNGTTEVISPLEMMAEMKCDEDATFETNGVPSDGIEASNIINCYNQHVTRMLNARDISANQRKALEFLHSIRGHITSQEAKSAWLSAEDAVRKKHTTVIHTILKFKSERDMYGDSLFGTDFDISDWVKETFSRIATQAEQRFGKPNIVIYEEK